MAAWRCSKCFFGWKKHSNCWFFSWKNCENAKENQANERTNLFINVGRKQCNRNRTMQLNVCFAVCECSCLSVCVCVCAHHFWAVRHTSYSYNTSFSLIHLIHCCSIHTKVAEEKKNWICSSILNNNNEWKIKQTHYIYIHIWNTRTQHVASVNFQNHWGASNVPYQVCNNGKR